jgi:hypothetical protein
MKRLLVLLLFAAAPAFAVPSLTVSWTHPTSRVNGVALALSEIQSTQITYSTCTTSGTLATPVIGTVIVLAPAAVSPAITVGITSGAYCAQAVSVLVDGQRSAPSNVGTKTIPISPPNPPTITTISATAYVVKSFLWFAYLKPAKGVSFEIGQPCAAPTRWAGYYYVAGPYIGRCAIS